MSYTQLPSVIAKRNFFCLARLVRSLAPPVAGLFLTAFFLLTDSAFSQTAFFADGFHGGIYGHYPPWVTQFMVDELKAHPEWKLNLEIEPETWDMARTNTPEAYAAFKAMLENQGDGRIEFVNPAFGQPYMWNISGESVIRQFSYGIKKVKEHFPNFRFATYASEEPCFTSALPGILKSFGFEHAVLKNPNTCWGGYTRGFGGELVNWIGPDGTAITTVPRYEVEALKKDSTWQTIAEINSKDYIQAALQYGIRRPVGMCLQDAGWKEGPWLRADRQFYKPSEYTIWRNYFQNTKALAQDWKFSQEDIQVSLVWGSQVLQRIAQESRAAENRLIMAEKLAAMAQIYKGVSWPQSSLDEAWKSLMLSQHHDCWIVPYNVRGSNSWASNVVVWTEKTKQASEGIIQRSIRALAGGSEYQGGAAAPPYQRVRVFNTMGTQRRDLAVLDLPAGWEGSTASVVDSSGEKTLSQVVSSPSKAVLFMANVPAMGYSTYRVEKSASESPKGATAAIKTNGECKIETDLYKIVLDPSKGGIFKSLVAKKIGEKELIDTENPRFFNEIRGYFFKEGKFCSSAENSASFRLLESGPLRVRVEIQGKIESHPVTQVITVVQGQERIDLSVKIDWQGNPGIGADYAQSGRFKFEDNQKAFYDDRYKLLALFPLKTRFSKVYKNAPFDVTESKLTNTLFTTWDGIKNNVILNWVDVVDSAEPWGMALLSDHTTSYTHGNDFPLGLTLQYSGMGLWGMNYKIKGPTEVHYALLPHAGKWDKAKLWSADDQWKEPLVAVAQTGKASGEEQKSLFNTAGSGFEISSLMIDGHDVVVRLFNAEGDSEPKTIGFDVPADRVQWVKLDGKVVQELEIKKNNEGKASVRLGLPRFGVATLRFVGSF